MANKKFMELVVSNKIKPDKIHDFIDKWHDSDSILSIHEYLGISKEDYTLFVQNDNNLIKIIERLNKK